MADWRRIANTTIKEYSRKVEENIMRNRKILAMLKAKGRISSNHKGDGMDWKIKYKRNVLIGYADTDTLTFSRRDKWKTAQLDYRGYSMTDSITKMEMLKNRDTEAIIKLNAEMAKNLIDDAEEQFQDEFWIDGNAAANGKRFHGIESFLGNNGVNAGNFVAVSTDTYAGLNTVLAGYSGTWTGTWPTGSGDAHYDFFTPLLVNYTDTGWTHATKTWPNTCVEALRFGIINSRRNKSQKGMLDFIEMNAELYRQFEAVQEAKERIIVSGKDGLIALGFPDVIRFNGCELTYEYGCPTGTAYGWNVDRMELCSMQSGLIEPEGPDYDIASKSWRYAVDIFGNFKFNPRYFVKWYNYT